jgi:hypothetical protein
MKYRNPTLSSVLKITVRILTKVIKEAKKMEYDRRIINSTNMMRTSWNLVNIE